MWQFWNANRKKEKRKIDQKYFFLFWIASTFSTYFTDKMNRVSTSFSCRLILFRLSKIKIRKIQFFYRSKERNAPHWLGLHHRRTFNFIDNTTPLANNIEFLIFSLSLSSFFSAIVLMFLLMFRKNENVLTYQNSFFFSIILRHPWRSDC